MASNKKNLVTEIIVSYGHTDIPYNYWEILKHTQKKISTIPGITCPSCVWGRGNNFCSNKLFIPNIYLPIGSHNSSVEMAVGC